MTDFLLIHGVGVAAWEWERTHELLDRDSRVGKVVAPDMPGRGENCAQPFKSIHLRDYVATAVAALRRHDLSDVVLVGHSGGGAYLQAVAAAEPQRIRHLVFLSGVITERGHSLLDQQHHMVRTGVRIGLQLLRAHRRGIMPRDWAVRRGLCHDLNQQDAAIVLDHIVPEPQALVLDRIDWDPHQIRVPSTYIQTTKDRVVRPRDQLRMAEWIPEIEIVPLHHGHMRPLMEPKPLVEILLRCA